MILLYVQVCLPVRPIKRGIEAGERLVWLNLAKPSRGIRRSSVPKQPVFTTIAEGDCHSSTQVGLSSRINKDKVHRTIYTHAARVDRPTGRASLLDQ